MWRKFTKQPTFMTEDFETTKPSFGDVVFIKTRPQFSTVPGVDPSYIGPRAGENLFLNSSPSVSIRRW